MTDEPREVPEPQVWCLERMDEITIELSADAMTVLLTQEDSLGNEGDRIQLPTRALPELIDRLQEVLAESRSRQARQP